MVSKRLNWKFQTMKYMHWIPLVLVITLLGCSPISQIYVSSLTDEKYHISKVSKITILNNESESIETKRFVKLLTEEMARMGFNLVDFSDADYVLLVYMDESIDSISGALPMSTTSYHSGNVGGSYYSGTSTGTTFVPITRRIRLKKIYLTLFDLTKYRENKQMVRVWDGYIGATDEDCKNMKDCLYTLLQYFGTDYEKRVYVQKDNTRVK